MELPSSPTSSDFGAPSSDFAELPISALRDKIVEKVQENRVTLIVGEPGCGKSSQVPQFLLEENMEPILCTQPRRFAVVAVANMVAKARNCGVGEEIGYHIGHSKVFSERSKIVFKTAGVLLDEMRDKGMRALKYNVIVLDEVHERSVESDLVLLCIKQFLLKNSSLRLVLMSATADITKYCDYFRNLGRGERVEVLAVPPCTNQHQIFQRKVLYLEQVTELLDMEPECSSSKYCSGRSPVTADAGIKANVHKLIHELIVHIHRNEPDIEKSILIFLPTYYSLEQQWFLLKPFSRTFKVFVLHRSVNTAEALKAMKILKSHRKVILATNIAESSVTIPQVGYVIDSCRSLQVFWDKNRKIDCTELVWVSRSQADQRKGRTGRTCDGYVYRLVTRTFFNQLEEYESPAILKLSLRQQVLLLCCSDSRAINDPKALLQKALDPPDHEVVEDALDLLVRANALERRLPRGRYEPTFYGQLLSSFGLSFDASVLILKFGDLGLLREGILLGILMDLLPLPIVRPFGHGNLHMEYTSNYYAGDSKITGLTGNKEVFHMGNFCAFQFWQLVFKDKYRLENLKKLSISDETTDKTTVLLKIEEEWCTFHNLLQSALHEVAETYDEILNSLHRFRPKSLLNSNSLPLYYDTCEYQHTCFLKDDESDEDASYNNLALDARLKACAAVPFVSFNDFRTSEVAEKLAIIVKEMRVMLAEVVSGNNVEFAVGNDSYGVKETPLCIYFLKGFCNRGSQCKYAHSLQGKRPPCMFVYSLKGCRNGESCPYSHDLITPSSITMESLCLPDDDIANLQSLIQLFPDSPEGCVLLVDDAELQFSKNLSRFIDSSSIIITTPSLRVATRVDPLLMDAQIIWDISHPVEAIIHKTGEVLVPWNRVECIMWYPQFDSDDLEVQKGQVKFFFEHLSLRMVADSLSETQVIITLNNVRFSQLQVEALARESFFFLKKSFPFDEISFGELRNSINVKKSMMVCKPFSYVFKLHTPSIVQFGDYRRELYRNLHKFR